MRAARLNLTNAELDALCDECQEARGSVRQIWQVRGDEWLIQTRADRENRLLTLSCNPDAARLHLTDEKDEARDADTFTMVLRKWLVGAHLESIRRVGDRTVVVSLTREGRWDLVLTTGRFANLVLVKDSQVVRSAVPRLAPPMSTWSVSPHAGDAGSVRWDTTQSACVAASDAAEEVLSRLANEEHRREVVRQFKLVLKRLRRRDAAVLRDLQRVEDCESLKRRGELLNTLHGQVRPGQTRVSVVDYWDPDMRTVDVELDPSMSLQANIDRAFKAYRRLKNARDRVEERWLATQSELEEVLSWQTAFEAGEMTPQAAEQALRKRRLWAPGQTPVDQRRAQRMPFRAFQTRRGVEVLVGRSAKDNDALTKRYARGRDIWLHARDVPGSHVVLRVDKNGQHDGQDLLDAALLAAWFSKLKSDGVVDVMWTHAKHVRKPKGAAPGSVSVAGSANVAVRMDEALLQVLLATEAQET